VSGNPGTRYPPAGRAGCPTCRAPRRGEVVCHRCRANLEPLIHLEQRADRLSARARRCYSKGWYRQAAALAGEAVSLESSRDHLLLAACASLMAGDFPAALRHYRAAAHAG
jgi:hypothetical protein